LDSTREPATADTGLLPGMQCASARLPTGLCLTEFRGPELKRLLSQDLPSCRVTVRVEEGQTLSGVARASGTTVGALLEANRRKRYEDVYPGERLVIHRRAVGALAEPWNEAEESAGCLDMIADFPWTFALLPVFTISDTGEIRSDEKLSMLAPGLRGTLDGNLAPIRPSGHRREEEDGQSPQSCQSPYPLHTIFGCRPQSESLPRRARRGSGGAREFILFFLDLQRLPMEPWPGSKAAEPGWLPMPARSPEKRLWRAWQV